MDRLLVVFEAYRKPFNSRLIIASQKVSDVDQKLLKMGLNDFDIDKLKRTGKLRQYNRELTLKAIFVEREKSC